MKAKSEKPIRCAIYTRVSTDQGLEQDDLLDAIGARAGVQIYCGATARVIFWGALATALTAGIEKVFGTVV